MILPILLFLTGLSFFFDTYAITFLLAIKNPVLDALLPFFSNAFIILLLLSIFFLVSVKSVKQIRKPAAAMVLTLFLALVIKFLVARERLIGEDFLLFLIPDYSFPSLKTAVMFSFIPFVSKKWSYLLLGIAVLVAFSRIYLFEHYLSDVVAGASLGLLMGLWIKKSSKV